jgi:hypothetical protein
MGVVDTAAICSGSTGGSSMMGIGGMGGSTNVTTNQNGTGFGSGGGGNCYDNTNETGGAGAPGNIIIWEYRSY